MFTERIAGGFACPKDFEAISSALRTSRAEAEKDKRRSVALSAKLASTERRLGELTLRIHAAEQQLQKATEYADEEHSKRMQAQDLAERREAALVQQLIDAQNALGCARDLATKREAELQEQCYETRQRKLWERMAAHQAGVLTSKHWLA
mmetsp:Transcript_59410/g.98475  ORF Transcript_59410/g.98475 Transcript_59410/m.98475 type:complete len:150 (-) Transcript_59410:445-894(-)|eukprot:CAMPEP_0119315568 /NCGR_PEP_ID=MMETSP1333-20130426/36373_1 /TAXON_ID=418940 /ORGANISM="Scyphosphaera apsteinii, Strain RCC1455" /LENGTH=149 /DNA_ID=CAMNT_0007320981 /DNA_START=94 /DNA_END=543 /DNA_ORIENTATION=+